MAVATGADVLAADAAAVAAAATAGDADNRGNLSLNEMLIQQFMTATIYITSFNGQDVTFLLMPSQPRPRSLPRRCRDVGGIYSSLAEY